MKSLQIKLKAVWEITQTLVMFLVGLGGVVSGLLIHREDLQFLAIFIGTVCAILGFIPMFTAFVKTSWPKK